MRIWSGAAHHQREEGREGGEEERRGERASEEGTGVRKGERGVEGKRVEGRERKRVRGTQEVHPNSAVQNKSAKVQNLKLSIWSLPPILSFPSLVP